MDKVISLSFLSLSAWMVISKFKNSLKINKEIIRESEANKDESF